MPDDRIGTTLEVTILVTEEISTRKRLLTMTVVHNQTMGYVACFIPCDRCVLVLVGDVGGENGVSHSMPSKIQEKKLPSIKF